MKQPRHVTLDEGIIVKVEKIARAKDRSFSWVVNNILNNYLEDIK